MDMTSQLHTLWSDPILLLRAIFLTIGAGILLLYTIPALRDRFLAYGQRYDKDQDQAASSSLSKDDRHRRQHESSKSSTASTSLLTARASQSVLDPLVKLRVPHSWFTHFYVLSVCCSLFWGYQIRSKGSAFEFIASRVHQHPAGGDSTREGVDDGLSMAMPVMPMSTMSVSQVYYVWSLMFAQGLRRLYECVYYSKETSSTIWIGHWLFGVVFYSLINIAIWIEGAASILAAPQVEHTTVNYLPSNLMPTVTFGIAVWTPLFLLASGVQHDVHVYLSSLPSRSPGVPKKEDPTSSKDLNKTSPVMPQQPLFSIVVCPHYTCEILIYLSLALLGAPEGYWINRTLLCAVVLVGLNLGVTADLTRKWWCETWGQETVRPRKRIIPGVW